MRLTYIAIAVRVYTLVAERLERKGEDAQWCLEGLLPLDRERHKCWRVYFAYWGVAIGDAKFAREQGQRAENARGLVKRVLKASIAAGSSPAGLDLEASARDLLSVVLGTSAQSVFDPKHWPPKRQTEALARALHALSSSGRRNSRARKRRS